jgi:hypothetical protein
VIRPCESVHILLHIGQSLTATFKHSLAHAKCGAPSLRLPLRNAAGRPLLTQAQQQTAQQAWPPRILCTPGYSRHSDNGRHTVCISEIEREAERLPIQVQLIEEAQRQTANGRVVSTHLMLLLQSSQTVTVKPSSPTAAAAAAAAAAVYI